MQSYSAWYGSSSGPAPSSGTSEPMLAFFVCGREPGRPGRTGIALGPDAWLVQLLRRSGSRATRPARPPVQVIPAAIASEALDTHPVSGQPVEGRQLPGRIRNDPNRRREEQSVVAVSLDWLLESLAPPSVVKIDVEGAEIEVSPAPNAYSRQFGRSSSAR